MKNNKPARVFIFIGLSLYAFYWLYFTVTPFFEGDDGFTLAGIAGMIKGMEGIPLYRENVQPLYENLFKGIYCLFPELPLSFLPSLANILSILCFVFSIFFLYSGVRRLASEKFALYFLIACFLIPEIIISGAYPNSSILALLFLCLSFYLLSLPRSNYPVLAAAGAAMVFAFYARSDAVFLFPCFFLAVYLKKKDVKSIAFTVVVMAAVWLFFMKLFRLDVFSLMKQVRMQYIQFAWWPFGSDILHLSSALPLGIIIMAISGLLNMAARRRWLAVLLFSAGFFPLAIFYIMVLVDPRYLLYIYPFIAWMASEGWLALSGLRARALRSTLKLLLVIILSAQFFFTVPSIYPKGKFFGQLSIIGGKCWFWTNGGGPRLLSGIVYYPCLLKKTWSAIKTRETSWPVDVYGGRDRMYLFSGYLDSARAFFSLVASAAKKIDSPFRINFDYPFTKVYAFLMPDGSRVVYVAYYSGKSPLDLSDITRVIENGQREGFISVVINPDLQADATDAFVGHYRGASVLSDTESGSLVVIPAKKL